MFYVFGINGPMYRGGPERLSQIAPVRGVRRPAGLKTGYQPSGGASSQSHAGAGHGEPGLLDVIGQAIDDVLGEPAHKNDPNAMNRRGGPAAAYARAAGQGRPKRRPLTIVRDVMTQGALTVTARIPLMQAWTILAEHRVAQAPVLDDTGRVVGLLLRGDMAPPELLPMPGAVHQATIQARRPVSEVMVSPVPAVAEVTELRRVAHVLLETGLPGLPVTDDEGNLSGFVSRTDILRAVASDPPLDLWG